MKNKLLFLIWVFIVGAHNPSFGIVNRQSFDKSEIEHRILPHNFRKAIESLQYDFLGDVKGCVELRQIDKNVLHVKISFLLNQNLSQDNWEVSIKPAFKPNFHWAPHLTPTDNHVIDQHVFRSPSLIASDDKQVLILVPDIDLLPKEQSVRWYMDLDALSNTLSLGMCDNHVSEHVLFKRSEQTVYPSGELNFGFYMMLYTDKESILNPFRRSLSFLWNRWGHHAYKSGNPIAGSLLPYINHTYNWAFNSWSNQVWQEFKIGGKEVGAPVFIVNATQSPNYLCQVNEREFRSIWNQAWFSSLRSASGLYRYARRTGDEQLLEKANLTKELALSFPQIRGFFYGLIATEMHEVSINGINYNRSKGWNTYYWGNSNRNPYTWNPKESPFHILDMSWTSLLMLRWYDELERDERLLEYAENYAKSLIGIQYDNGFFPAWLDLKSLKPMQHLNESPESSLSVTFLLKLFEITGKSEYKKTAFKAMDAVIEHIIPIGRWEDFETYWSCSRYGSVDLVGNKIVRNNMFKQNNFSMFWTAEALLECYKLTNDARYLALGKRTLDEMLMTQASWQPPYMYVNVLGGFGVLNADGEWNDSRGSLFAELIIRYGRLLNEPEYIERGYAALRASFVMMYCEENVKTKEQWEKVYPYFNHKDYGFMMENYGHGGRTNPLGEGMGEFTIYDWGNGAAAEAYNRILDKYGVIE